jgi:serine/threonine-protein kinase
MTLDTAHWQRLDALLKEALALAPEERTRWLETLGPEDQQHRPMLLAMLARANAETSEFMGRPVAPSVLAAATDVVDADRVGDVVGPYRLIAHLGVGGMGTVWRAERVDGSVQRAVALKLPRTGWTPGLAERLKRECDILSTLEHPGIARLYEAGVAGNGRPWLAMEIIDGQPIDAYCNGKSLAVGARLALFLEVAGAIAYAHARLVVHRDLKPSNILVDATGRVHVVDFGLAKLIDADAQGQPQLTQALGRTLTPDYASPEQIHGGAIGVGTDVYSLGVVLYELLAGQRPYRLKRDSAAALEEAILEADVPLASSRAAERGLARALRGDLDTILAKALAKDVAERYSTIEAFATDVQRHLRGLPITARPASFGYRAGRFVKRHRAAVAAVAVVSMAVLAGLAGTLYQARQAAAERDRALRELRFAEATDEFMRFLLSEQSAKPLPAPELLRRAEKSASQQFADDAALRARLQLLLADLHGELADYRRAEAILAEARKSAEAAGDKWMMTQADCVRAALLVATGRPKEGQDLFARTMPAVEADPLADPNTTQVCYSQRSVALRNLGKGEASARDAEAAIATLDAAGSGNRVNRIFLRTNIGDALTNAGRVREAVAIYEQAVVELGRIGRGGTSAGLMLTSNLIVMLTRAGQPRKAVDVYGRLVLGEDPDPPAYSSLAINYARVLFDVGRAEEAERLLEQGRGEKVRLGDKRGEAFAMLTAAGAACSGTDVARCETLLEEAAGRLRPMLPPKHSAHATLQYLAGRAWLTRGDAARARPFFENAVTLFEAAPDRNFNVIRALSHLALAQQQMGEGVAARATAARAVDQARKATSGYETSEWLGSALFAQAIIAASQADPATARKLLAEARTQLIGSVGPGTPGVAKVDKLLEQLPR